MSKQANIDVIINGEQAKAVLVQIEKELVQVKTLKDKAFAEGDVKGYNLLNAEFKKLTSESNKAHKGVFDVNEVLKNLSSASTRELNVAYQVMNRELKDMKHNDPGYAEKEKQVKSLKDEMNKTNGSVQTQSTSIKGLMGSLIGFASGMGLAVGSMEMIKGIISATDTVSDKWEETIGGMKNGMHYFAVALTSLDFSNFLTNMRIAIKAGADYVAAMDAIGDRTRGMAIIEADDAKHIAEMDVISKDVTKSKEQRLAALTVILNLEKKNADLALGIAKDNANAELNIAAQSTGLSKARIRELLIENTTRKESVKTANEYIRAVGTLAEASVSKNTNPLAYLITKDQGALEKAKKLIESTTPAIREQANELSKLGKIGEPSYIKLSAAISAAGQAEAAYDIDNAKRLVRQGKLNKGILDDEEKLASKTEKDAQKQLTAYEKVNEAIKNKQALLNDELTRTKGVVSPLSIQIATEIAGLQEEAAKIQAVIDALLKKASIRTGTTDVKGIKSIDVPVLSGDGTKPILGPASNFDKKKKEAQAKVDEKKQDAAKKKAEEYKNMELSVASTAVNLVADMKRDALNREYDHKLALMNKQMDAELSIAGLTEDQKNIIRAKYAKKENALKTEQFKKQKEADIITSLINTALAVVKALPDIPLSIIAGAAGAAETTFIATQKAPEFYEGGFTPGDNSDQKPTGVVHANEFVGSAKAVRNPSVKPVFDIIDYAQKSGTISQINLPALVASTTGKGRLSGGYASDSLGSAISIIPPGGPGPMSASEAWATMKDITQTLKQIQKDGIKGNWSLFDLEKIQKDKSTILSATEM